MKKLKKIWNAVRPKSKIDREYEYLSQASDICDLERRMRALQNGYVNNWDANSYKYYNNR